MSKKILMILGIIMFVVAGIFGVLKFNDIFREETVNTHIQSEKTEAKEPEPEQAEFDKTKHPTDQPGSIWWVVNKTRPLPEGYVPPDLVIPEVQLRLGSSNEQMKISNTITPALKQMFDAAASEGVTLVFGSGYRSEALQRQFYNGYVAADGQAEADRLSARPGTSEHQTGLSFDATSASQACHLETCFKDTPEGAWLAANSYKYGFIIRYPEGKEPITGYSYEPWHMRYVGKELSEEMHRTGVQTLEEFFGLPPAPAYL